MSAPIAVFPGSFDPVTVGHFSIVERALPLFERIYIGLGRNTGKKSMFPLEKRMEWLEVTFKDMAQVEVVSFEGLTVDLCRKLHATFILRGLRNSTDHGYERSIALMNMQIGKVDTLFLPSAPEHAHVSSTIVREMIANNASVEAFVPPGVRIA
ncbi:MAG: pantetheine-phosphate adenylyltransferase [Flavobacteriales bacterium]|nr:pantetheine-phosphate adenylyltransferase [Flavobacteriales bacterium]